MTINWPDMTRDILLGSNRFWRSMYYDGLIDGDGYQISFLRNSDRLYYNAAHALHRSDPQILSAIEAEFSALELPPSVYTDPEAPNNLSDQLTARGYRAIPEETEHWYGYALSENRLPVAPPNGAIVRAFTPGAHEMLDHFMAINSSVNNLPPAIASRLRDRLLKKPVDVDLHLFVAYLDGKPTSTCALGIVNDLAFTAEAATLPAFQRRGLFLTLTDAVIQKAREKGCHAICVNCDAYAFSNQGYQRYGYDRLFSREYYLKETA